MCITVLRCSAERAWPKPTVRTTACFAQPFSSFESGDRLDRDSDEDLHDCINGTASYRKGKFKAERSMPSGLSGG